MTRGRTSSTAPSASVPSRNGPKEMRISRFTSKPIRQGAPDLAVLALAQADRQPCIRALLTVERHLHRLITDTLHLDALPQRFKICVGRRALDPHAVLAQPTRAGQLQLPLDPAIIGQEQQALGSQVQPPDTHDPRHGPGSASKTVLRPFSSEAEVTRPAGLW
jgi:hypothetical protein